MKVLSHDFKLPDMRVLKDAEEVKSLLMSLPGTEDVDCDLRAHVAHVQYVNPEGLHMLRERLSAAGFPPVAQ